MTPVVHVVGNTIYTHHIGLNPLKKKLTKELDKLPLRVIRDSCNLQAFTASFRR